MQPLEVKPGCTQITLRVSEDDALQILEAFKVDNLAGLEVTAVRLDEPEESSGSSVF